MEPTSMPKLLKILDDGGDKNNERKRGEAKASSACVVSSYIGCLTFIMRMSYLFDLFAVFFKLNLLAT